MAVIKPSKPPKATLATLRALGAERLAELLLAAARSDPALKRSLTLEVAADPADVAEELDRQIERVRASTGRLNGRKVMVLARELVRIMDAVVLKLGDADAPAAVARLLDVQSLEPDLLQRRTGEGRALVEAFATLPQRLAQVLPKLEPADQAGLADALYRAVLAKGQTATPPFYQTIVPALPPGAREPLARLIHSDLTEIERAPKRTAPALQRHHLLTGVLALLADASGDVDAFVAAHERRDPRLRDHVAIAERLLTAGRAGEALALLDAAPPGATTSSVPFRALRIALLDAVGRREDAQAQRWALFETTLSVDLLRSHLGRLPDFEDAEREEEALRLAERHPDTAAAIAFLAAWPAHRRAGALVRSRYAGLNGDAAAVLALAAEALAYRDPLAATLLLRVIINAVLLQGRVAEYARAGRLLVDCSGLAASVEDWEGRIGHDAYVQRLRNAHSSRKAFWRSAAAAL